MINYPERLIAIGDVHGRLRKLEFLLAQISPRKEDTLVFLGDYIDRGPDSYKVIELLIRLKKEFQNTITLRGNHEDFVLTLFKGNQSKSDRDIWLTANGGNLTMASYRYAGQNLKVHKGFYESLPIIFESRRYFFCHAGIKRGVSLYKQKKIDLLNTRGPYPHPDEHLGKIVVHGHEIVEKPLILPNRINIDTGAGNRGPLTAIELPFRNILQSW